MIRLVLLLGALHFATNFSACSKGLQAGRSAARAGSAKAQEDYAEHEARRSQAIASLGRSGRPSGAQQPIAPPPPPPPPTALALAIAAVEAGDSAAPRAAVRALVENEPPPPPPPPAATYDLRGPFPAAGDRFVARTVESLSTSDVRFQVFRSDIGYDYPALELRADEMRELLVVDPTHIEERFTVENNELTGNNVSQLEPKVMLDRTQALIQTGDLWKRHAIKGKKQPKLPKHRDAAKRRAEVMAMPVLMPWDFFPPTPVALHTSWSLTAGQLGVLLGVSPSEDAVGDATMTAKAAGMASDGAGEQVIFDVVVSAQVLNRSSGVVTGRYDMRGSGRRAVGDAVTFSMLIRGNVKLREDGTIDGRQGSYEMEGPMTIEVSASQPAPEAVPATHPVK